MKNDKNKKTVKTKKIKTKTDKKICYLQSHQKKEINKFD